MYYLNSKLYKLDSFCKRLQIKNIEIVAIFAVLFGNDYVDSAMCQSFMISFTNENNNLKSKSSKSRKLNLNKRILEWLNISTDTDDCIKRILKFIKKELHNDVTVLIKTSIDNYINYKNELFN